MDTVWWHEYLSVCILVLFDKSQDIISLPLLLPDLAWHCSMKLLQSRDNADRKLGWDTRELRQHLLYYSLDTLHQLLWFRTHLPSHANNIIQSISWGEHKKSPQPSCLIIAEIFYFSFHWHLAIRNSLLSGMGSKFFFQADSSVVQNKIVKLSNVFSIDNNLTVYPVEEFHSTKHRTAQRRFISQAEDNPG